MCRIHGQYVVIEIKINIEMQKYMITRATEINVIVIVWLVVLNNAMIYRAAIEHKL